jgi:phage gpG-like protein
VKISVELEGWDELQLWMDQAVDKLTRTEPLFRTLGNLFVRDSMETFIAQSFHGNKWPELSPVTVGGTHPALGGQSRGSGNILHPSGVHIMQTIDITEIGNDYVVVGTPTPWAHVHNLGAQLSGTAFGNIRIPKRQFIGLHDENIADALKAVEYYLHHDVLGGS